MARIFHSGESARLRQEIISQCTWSDTYSSLKHILKRTAHQLPLMISFLNADSDDPSTGNETYRTVFFFDRTVSNKLLLTPLEQHEDHPEQFEISPKHCTFTITDLFKGLFEFIRDGQRVARVFTNLEQLLAFATTLKGSTVFMSRDRALGYYQDPSTSQWASKEYPRGAIFRAECVHRSSVTTNDGHRIPNDYLECYDEEGYVVFVKTDQNGRFSLVATSIEQQQNQPEIYVHSTQTPNVGQLIKHVTLQNNSSKNNNNNCIRLVRGPVPNSFYCQYFRLVRQHEHDVLVGLTQEGLVIECNLDSHVPCRYATNLNEILDGIYSSPISQTLESYVDHARAHYRESFQLDIQLVSTIDWTAFFQYWKSIGKLHRKHTDDTSLTYQSRHRFHIVGSIQDLTSHPRALASAFRKYQSSTPLDDSTAAASRKSLSTRQHSLLSQVTKLIPTPKSSKRQHSNRASLRNPLFSALLNATGERPFDDSIYDSNQVLQTSSRDRLVKSERHTSKRT